MSHNIMTFFLILRRCQKVRRWSLPELVVQHRCSVGLCIILAEDTTAIREIDFYEGVVLV